MKQTIVIAVSAALLLAAAPPAEAAGCIKGAIVGGIAAKATHHSVLLGALGGCIVGRVLAHPSSSITYDEVTGPLLGAQGDLKKVEAASSVNIIKLSSLRGYRAHDVKAQGEIAASAQVKALDAAVAADAGLMSALKSAGFSSSDVIAASSGVAGGATLFVNA
jgi:hypothetical protein